MVELKIFFLEFAVPSQLLMFLWNQNKKEKFTEIIIIK